MSIDAGTLVDLEECLAAEFSRLFEGKTYYNSLGHAVPLRAYTHALPVKQGSDEDPTDSDVPEPYIVSEIQNGKKENEDEGTKTSSASLAECWSASASAPILPGSLISGIRLNGPFPMRTLIHTTTEAFSCILKCPLSKKRMILHNQITPQKSIK